MASRETWPPQTGSTHIAPAADIHMSAASIPPMALSASTLSMASDNFGSTPPVPAVVEGTSLPAAPWCLCFIYWDMLGCCVFVCDIYPHVYPHIQSCLI